MKTILYTSLILGPILTPTICFFIQRDNMNPVKELSAPGAIPVTREGGWEGQAVAGGGGRVYAGSHTKSVQILKVHFLRGLAQH